MGHLYHGYVSHNQRVMITTHFPTFDHLLALLEIGLWVDETSPIHGQCKRTNLDTDGVSAKKEGNTCMLEVFFF